MPDVEPTIPELKNPTCSDLDLGTFSIKIDPPVSGTFALGPLDSVTTTISADGLYVDWTSTMGIDAVIVKGGPAANVYVYSPESRRRRSAVVAHQSQQRQARPPSATSTSVTTTR